MKCVREFSGKIYGGDRLIVSRRIEGGWSQCNRGEGMLPLEWCGFLSGMIWLKSG
jgi:hypothetical protein